MTRPPWNPDIYLLLRRWSGDRWLVQARAQATSGIPRQRRG